MFDSRFDNADATSDHGTILRIAAELLAKGDLPSAAFFAPSPDLIVLPERVRFSRAEDYYATATHELSHWTGHKSRLDRDFKGRFGDSSYAFEELVAEIGSAFINAELGLEGDLQHASYIKHWLEIMKDDKRAIFSAASQASKAHQFIMEKTANISQKEAAA